MKMKSTTGGQHSFAQIPSANIQRSSFDRSCGHKTTFDAGYLIPIFCDEALPGDTMNLQHSQFARMATPIFPIMDNVYLDTFFFFVPNRLLWENWERMNGAQDKPGDSTDFLVPTVTPTLGWGAHQMGDYFGIPTGKPLAASALWFRAYNLIWNEFFRDENLQDPAVIHLDDANQSEVDYPIRRRGKRHDYFTSCLPFVQKGPSVEIPLGDTAPMIMNPAQIPFAAGTPRWDYDDQTGQLLKVKASDANVFANTNPTVTGNLAFGTTSGDSGLSVAGLTGTVDLTAATAATINSLRQAFQIQKIYEKDARGGTRYIEQIKAHFGVTSPDARLQRPEFLGGGSTPLQVGQVPQTSETDTTPQGTLAAYATFGSSGHGFTKSFVEHGVILGLMSVRADLSYMQGMPRQFSRRARFDFYFPTLAHLGEQAVLNKEIFMNDDANDELVFGYQERFAEYRYKPSIITGKMRSQASGSLDPWHLAQDFGTLPVLGDTFIQDTPPFDRVEAIPTEPDFIYDCHFTYRCARPMPVFSVPGLVDHF